MKAAVRRKYGGPDVLIIAEVEKPVPRRDEVLVKVVATTVNRSDYHVLTGKPWFMRFFTGLSKPTLHVTGSDFVGYVEAVGKDVTTFKGGQRVMGFIDMGSQSHAEYLVIKEPRLTLAPSNLRDEEVPACLEGAFYALCAVNALDLRAGQKAMVLGATGAIGTSYVQLLRSQGWMLRQCARVNTALWYDHSERLE
jgi:NADPH:quinone reductase-like Zn-dependent oxidoreductase